MKELLELVLIFVLAIAVAIYQMFVATKVWALAVMPFFPGAPKLSFMAAIGISFFLGVFRIDTSQNRAEKKKKETAEIVGLVIAQALMLTIGWGLAAWVF